MYLTSILDWVSQKSKMALCKDLIQVIGGSLALSLLSQIAFPLPFSPVPVSLQTVALFLIGISLGPWKGGASVLLYLLQGAAGFPVFAMGSSGLAVLMGPRGGYLIGFVCAVLIIGGLTKNSQNFWKIAGSFFLGNGAIYALGLSWLALFVGSEQALVLGFYPFIIGDLLKILGAAAIVKGVLHFKIDKI